MERFFDIRFLLGVLRRRWPLLVAALALGLPLAAAVAYMLPPTYASTARVLVEAQQIPSDLARSTVASDTNERIQLIEQRLTARQNLLELARRHDVFRGRPDLSPTEIVDRMREATRIRSIDFDVGRRREANVSAIEIAFFANNPRIAAQVAGDFLTQLLEQNVRDRSARASETHDFFTREVERLGAELAALEQRISAFKSDNKSDLPESLEFRRSELAGLRRESFVQESRRIALQDQRARLEEQAATGLVSAEGRAPEQQELRRLRASLAQQRAVFSDRHPAVRSLNAQIAALEAAIGGETLTDAEDPAEALPSLASQIERDIERIDAELALLDQQGERDQARIEAIEASIARTPQVEITLNALYRDYDALQTRYRQAVLKQAEAATGERLEVNQQAERFEVIEQPQVTAEPVSPNRVMVAGAGGVLSVGLGLGLMLLAELLNPALRSARDMERRMQLRPVVSIPYIRTTRELRRRKWALRLGIFSVLVLIPGLLLLVDLHVLPLPVLIERLAEQSGLDEMIKLFRMRFGG